METTNTAPNTGLLLKEYFASKRIYKSALARVLNRNLKTILSYEKNSTIQTSVLWEICFALKHNFFMDIASQLPQEFATNTPKNTDKEEQITELKQQIALLTAEKNILLEALKKG